MEENESFDEYKERLNFHIESLHQHHDDEKLQFYYRELIIRIAFAKTCEELKAIEYAIYDPDDYIPEPYEPKPCIICNKLLDAVNDDWKTMQPYDGGEVQFHFAYGSSKFDDMECPSYKGVICDDCALKCVEKMDKV